MTREQAIHSLIAHGFKVEQVREIIKAVTPQEQQSFKWCTDCKEYDQEKHCCHRWSKVIRDTVEEMKQEQEPKTGHWEYGYAFSDGNYCKCSECKEIIKCIYPMHYCPNCGAKMVEPQESEE